MSLLEEKKQSWALLTVTSFCNILLCARALQENFPTKLNFRQSAKLALA
jgi:hypothetical protein